MSEPIRLQLRIHHSESPRLYQLLQGIDSPMMRRNRVLHLLEAALSGLHAVPAADSRHAVGATSLPAPAGASERASSQVIDTSDLGLFGVGS